MFAILSTNQPYRVEAFWMGKEKNWALHFAIVLGVKRLLWEF